MYELNQENQEFESVRNSNGMCFGPEGLQNLSNLVLKFSTMDKTTEEVEKVLLNFYKCEKRWF